MTLTIREVDALVREASIEMLGNDALNSRYITSLNMIRAASRGMSPGMLRLRPEAVKTAKKERPEAL
jgi:hypothetical protein